MKLSVNLTFTYMGKPSRSTTIQVLVFFISIWNSLIKIRFFQKGLFIVSLYTSVFGYKDRQILKKNH